MSLRNALDSYQLFTVTTAQYPEALAVPYLGLGLGDEAGELLEKIELMTSEGRSAAWGLAHALPEAGDVCWYLAQLLHRLGHSLGDAYAASQALDPAYPATLNACTVEAVIACAGIQGRLKKGLRDGQVDEARLLHYAARVLRSLDSIARWFGSTLAVVIAQNQAKLSDRLERNVIKGEGDNR
jgi:NTP pyrophosphatase (non-canonical NTP hydrolase)